MTKITSDHLARSALVYVRQSTADQVLNHHESRRRQYALVERARALGWATVEVIDDDLGRSGSGIARPGFEKLLAAICQGRVGAVVSIEAGPTSPGKPSPARAFQSRSAAASGRPLEVQQLFVGRARALTH